MQKNMICRAISNRLLLRDLVNCGSKSKTSKKRILDPPLITGSIKMNLTKGGIAHRGKR